MTRGEERGLFALTADEAQTLELALNAYGGKLRGDELDAAWALILRLHAWIERRREGVVSLHDPD